MSFILNPGYMVNLDGYEGSDRFDYWREVVNNKFVSLTCDPYNDEQDLNKFDAHLRGGLELGKIEFAEVNSQPQIVNRTQKDIARSGESDFKISIQVKGSCTVKQDGKQAVLTPGSFVLCDSAEPYSLAFSEAFHQFVIQMPREVLSRHLMQPEKYTAVPINAISGLGLVVKDFIFSLAKELKASEAVSNELLSENLINLIALSFSSTVLHGNLAESDSVKHALMRRVRQFIETNLFDPKLNNRCIAESQGISLRYLHKLFEDEEESLHEMILNKRLAAAHDLLVLEGDNKLTVESVAYHVGFSGAPHFSRSFKLKYGICPSNARS